MDCTLVSQLRMRSTAMRRNFLEYRFRPTLLSFPSKVCPYRLSHFKGAVQFQPSCAWEPWLCTPRNEMARHPRGIVGTETSCRLALVRQAGIGFGVPLL